MAAPQALRLTGRGKPTTDQAEGGGAGCGAGGPGGQPPITPGRMREIFQAPRSWAEQAYPNLIYFNEVDRGGHFAAWEEPELFSSELREAFRSLR